MAVIVCTKDAGELIMRQLFDYATKTALCQYTISRAPPNNDSTNINPLYSCCNFYSGCGSHSIPVGVKFLKMIFL